MVSNEQLDVFVLMISYSLFLITQVLELNHESTDFIIEVSPYFFRDIIR